MFAVKCNHHRLLVDPHKVAICHWGCGAHTQNLTSQCTLTKEVPLTHYADRGFFAGLGYDGEQYFTFLDIEDSVRPVPLRNIKGFFGTATVFLPSPIVARKGVEIAVFPSRSSSTRLFLILVPKGAFIRINHDAVIRRPFPSCLFRSEPFCTVLPKRMSDPIDVSREQYPPNRTACPS
jgi:hypothetical protein